MGSHVRGPLFWQGEMPLCSPWDDSDRGSTVDVKPVKNQIALLLKVLVLSSILNECLIPKFVSSNFISYYYFNRLQFFNY